MKIVWFIPTIILFALAACASDIQSPAEQAGLNSTNTPIPTLQNTALASTDVPTPVPASKPGPTPVAEPTLAPTFEPVPTPIATPLPTSTPRPTAPPSPTSTLMPTATPSPPPTLIGPRVFFGAGTWIVGVDLAPGLYRNSGGESCLWSRLSGFSGGISETISNDFTDSIVTVQIDASDIGFSSTNNCGTWRLAPTSGPQNSSFGSGTWIVGVDLAPGLYRNTGGESCFWSRLSGFSGGTSETISNDFTDSIATVQIDASDAGFSSTNNCGNWSRVG